MKLPLPLPDGWRGQGVLARPALGWSAIEKGKAGQCETFKRITRLRGRPNSAPAEGSKGFS